MKPPILTGLEAAFLKAVSLSPMTRTRLSSVGDINLGQGTSIETGIGTLGVISQLSQGLNGFLFRLETVGSKNSIPGCRTSDEAGPIVLSFLLKMPVGQLDLYARIFAFEVEILALCRKIQFPALPLVSVEKKYLLKKFTQGRLFSDLYRTGELNIQARSGFGKLQEEAQKLYIDYSIPVDLSPDNLIWNGAQWFVMDSAPPLLKEKCPEWIFKSDWKTYLEYYQPLLKTRGDSRAWESTENHGFDSMKFDRHIYIEKLKTWFPLAEYRVEEFNYPVSMSYEELRDDKSAACLE